MKKIAWILAMLMLCVGSSWAAQADDPPAPGGDTASPESTSPEKTAVVSDPAGEKKQGPSATLSANTADDAYDLKLRGLEERVNELKEKVFRTKARILQLQETMLTGSIGAGARAIIVHRNEMGGAFKLVNVQYALDTQPIFKKVDVDGDLDDIEEKEIFSGNIVPGNHNIAVKMVFQGQGFGFFSYVKGYKFKVTSSYTFTAEEGKILTLKTVAFERGGITAKLEERPAIRYDIKIEKLTSERAKALQDKGEETN